MDSEELIIDKLAVEKVNKVKQNRKKYAVGTTVCEVLRVLYLLGMLNQFEGWTHKFIFPPMTSHCIA